MVFGELVFNTKQRLEALAKFKRYLDQKKKKEGKKKKKRKRSNKSNKTKKGVKAIKVQV